MTETLTPDLCIVGPGAASLAAAAAAFGATVVVVEKNWAAGGPAHARVVSQALAGAAGRAHALRSSGTFGISAGEPGVDFKAVIRHVHAVIAATAPNASPERLTALGVKVVRAEARFKDRRTLIAGDTEIRARRFVLATGSTPALPSLAGLDGVGHLTEDTLSGLSRLPGHLIVLGDGPRAVELAQSFRRLGSEVTVLAETEALPGFDAEMAAVVLRRLRSEGTTVLEHAKAIGAERRGKTGIRLALETANRSQAIDGTHLLIAAGRTADTRGLDLDKAGIIHDDSGIPVNEALRTSNSRISAIGEAVAGGAHSPELTEHQAALLVRTLLFRQTTRRSRAVVPAIVLTDPELAHVGLSEVEATRTQKATRILRWPYAENVRAQAERRTEGHIKLVVGAKAEILGVTIAGAGAAELIGAWTLALSKGLTLADMAAQIVPYPTMGEIGKRAAIAYFAASARKPLLRRLVNALRIFG